VSEPPALEEPNLAASPRFVQLALVDETEVTLIPEAVNLLVSEIAVVVVLFPVVPKTILAQLWLAPSALAIEKGRGFAEIMNPKRQTTTAPEVKRRIRFFFIERFLLKKRCDFNGRKVSHIEMEKAREIFARIKPKRLGSFDWL
jgi:hypothetical protein